MKRVVELLGFEDEVVVEYAMGLLEDQAQPVRQICVHSVHLSDLLLDAGSQENANQFDWISD